MFCLYLFLDFKHYSKKCNNPKLFHPLFTWYLYNNKQLYKETLILFKYIIEMNVLAESLYDLKLFIFIPGTFAMLVIVLHHWCVP